MLVSQTLVSSLLSWCGPYSLFLIMLFFFWGGVVLVQKSDLPAAKAKTEFVNTGAAKQLQDMGFTLFATKSTHEWLGISGHLENVTRTYRNLAAVKHGKNNPRYMTKNGIACNLVYKPLIKREPNVLTMLQAGKIDMVIDVPDSMESCQKIRVCLRCLRQFSHYLGMIFPCGLSRSKNSTKPLRSSDRSQLMGRTLQGFRCPDRRLQDATRSHWGRGLVDHWHQDSSLAKPGFKGRWWEFDSVRNFRCHLWSKFWGNDEITLVFLGSRNFGCGSDVFWGHFCRHCHAQEVDAWEQWQILLGYLLLAGVCGDCGETKLRKFCRCVFNPNSGVDWRKYQSMWKDDTSLLGVCEIGWHLLSAKFSTDNCWVASWLGWVFGRSWRDLAWSSFPFWTCVQWPSGHFCDFRPQLQAGGHKKELHYIILYDIY